MCRDRDRKACGPPSAREEGDLAGIQATRCVCYGLSQSVDRMVTLDRQVKVDRDKKKDKRA